MSLTVSTIIPHKRILEEVFCLDERIHSVELRNQRPLILVIAGVGPYNGRVVSKMPINTRLANVCHFGAFEV